MTLNLTFRLLEVNSIDESVLIRLVELQVDLLAVLISLANLRDSPVLLIFYFDRFPHSIWSLTPV